MSMNFEPKTNISRDFRRIEKARRSVENVQSQEQFRKSKILLEKINNNNHWQSCQNHHEIARRSSSKFTASKEKAHQELLASKSSKQYNRVYFSKGGFPQRKQRKGEQQLIKLLLKLAEKNKSKNDNHIYGSSRYRLFQEDININQQMKPTLKTKTRLGWHRERHMHHMNNTCFLSMDKQEANTSSHVLSFGLSGSTSK